MDLEMPGPTRKRGIHLVTAFKEGHITEAKIDKCAGRVLKLLFKTGKHKTGDWQESREQALDIPEHRAILRKAGAEGKYSFRQ